MSRAERITKRIKEKYPGSEVSIHDETRSHIGHREMLSVNSPSETHLKIQVQAAEFQHMSLLEASRSINRLLKDELENGLHAVVIECRTPKEPPTHQNT